MDLPRSAHNVAIRMAFGIGFALLVSCGSIKDDTNRTTVAIVISDRPASLQRPRIQTNPDLNPGPTMTSFQPEFERLEQTIDMIRRHPYYPGKEVVLDECLEDIDERY